jgi:type II secretory pathway pseudopilin PulG
MPVLAFAACLLLATAVLALFQRARARAAELAALAAQVRELAQRLDAAEQDVGRAQTQADVAESLLVEKGVADEEDIAKARRRFDADAEAYLRARDGDLH